MFLLFGFLLLPFVIKNMMMMMMMMMMIYLSSRLFT